MADRTRSESRRQMDAFTNSVVNELKTYGVDLSSNISARRTIERHFLENPQSPQMTPLLLRTLLGYQINIIDPVRLIGIEREYYANHGLKFPAENNITLNNFFNDATGQRAVFSYSSNALSVYDAASRFLFSHLVKLTDEEKRLAPLVNTAYNAFAYNNSLLRLYNEGKTNTDEFRSLWNLRNASLSALGFGNLNKVAGAGSRPDHPLLIDADTPDKQQWNITMFNGFLAPILLSAEKMGLTSLDQMQHDTLNSAIRNDFSGWGYAVLGSFLSTNAANYLLSLRRDIS